MNSTIITKTHVNEKISKLRELASKHNCSIKFVRHKRHHDEEFVIFVYNKKENPNHYVVGYDGNWLASPEFMSNFDRCVGSAAETISKY